MDLIGLKFQVSDRNRLCKLRPRLRSPDLKDQGRTARELWSRTRLNSTPWNGKLQDLRNNYSLLRDLYEQAWLKSYRPYFLRNNLERYDYTIQMWLGRIDRMRVAQRQWANSQTLPPAADVGIPAPFTGTN